MNEITEHGGEYVPPQWQVDVHGNRIVEPVTLNMLNHADALGYDLDGEQYAAIYRAMVAVAPPSQHKQRSGVTDMWAEYLASQQRVTELTETGNELVDRLAKVQAHVADLRDKLNRKSEAAMRESDDKNETIARLRAEITELRVQGMVEVQAQGATLIVMDPLSQFSSAIPDPPRRPDGTLAPQPKPWTPPKASGDARRIGG